MAEYASEAGVAKVGGLSVVRAAGGVMKGVRSMPWSGKSQIQVGLRAEKAGLEVENAVALARQVHGGEVAGARYIPSGEVGGKGVGNDFGAPEIADRGDRLRDAGLVVSGYFEEIVEGDTRARSPWSEGGEDACEGYR